MLRILLVEDEENIRETVKLNFEMEDFEVVTAADGRAALKHAAEQHFDIMIVDVMLPEVNGFQVVEQIRLSNRETPIIFLTAKDQAQDRIQGLKKAPTITSPSLSYLRSYTCVSADSSSGRARTRSSNPTSTNSDKTKSTSPLTKRPATRVTLPSLRRRPCYSNS